MPLAKVLLLLDAGLRVGEAVGLTWGGIVWGTDDADPTRVVIIDRSRPRGGPVSTTKSGRARRVALSRRLRDALAELYRARFEPGPDALVLEGVDVDSFRMNPSWRVCKRAGIGHRSLKDLRDTFASQLLTAGVQLGWISAPGRTGAGQNGCPGRTGATHAFPPVSGKGCQRSGAQRQSGISATPAGALGARSEAKTSEAEEAWIPGEDSNLHSQAQTAPRGSKKR